VNPFHTPHTPKLIKTRCNPLALRVRLGKIVMKTLFLVSLCCALVWGQNPNDTAPQVQATALTEGQLNVNSRYTIESVQVIGWREKKISTHLRSALNQIVGEKLDHPHLDLLAQEIKKEIHAANVQVKVVRGSIPDQVAVTFEIPPSHELGVDLNVARFLYHSAEGWSAEGNAGTRIKGNNFTFGMVSDSDAALERFAGVRAGFERSNVGTDRLSVRFGFAAYHDQWNDATLQADAADTYRTRYIFEPQATFVLAEPLALDFGVRVSRYRLAAPLANTESSNAVVSTLRYHQRWGSDLKDVQQEGNANYSVTVATHVLASDPTYARHSVSALYRLKHAHNLLELSFLGGKIAGIAPLFDRFVLGNATTLRGWSKYALDPLGGSHVVHGSINYAYRRVQAFYDTGAVWDKPSQKQQKQSVGVGFKASAFQLAVAFPVGAGHTEPIFYGGMNF